MQFKTITVIMLCLALQGCFHQSVNAWDIYRASKLCGSVEDIVVINAFANGAETATCKNNERIDLNDYRGK